MTPLPSDATDDGTLGPGQASHGGHGGYGGWPTGCILAPVGIGFFLVAMNAGLSLLLGCIYAVGALPVVVGIASSRHRGACSEGARVARGLGWTYLVTTGVIWALLAIP